MALFDRVAVSALLGPHRSLREHDAYVTDRVRLFRVIAPIDPHVGVEDAVLEDCATLAWRSYSASQLGNGGCAR
jgi:hypothetical protein